MSSDFISGTVLTAEALNQAFGHHVDCNGGDQMYGPLFMWDGDGSALALDGTDYFQGACRGWTRDFTTAYVQQAIQDTWTNPPGNIIFLPLTGGTLTGDLYLSTKAFGAGPVRIYLQPGVNHTIGMTTADGAWINACGATWGAFNGIGFPTTCPAQPIPVGLNSVVVGTRGGDLTAFGVITGNDGGLNRVHRIGFLRSTRTSATEVTLQVLGNIGYISITDGAGAPGAGASGGSGWSVNDRCYDAYGSTYTVLAVTGSAVTQLRQDRQGVCVTSQIVNPMALTAAPGFAGTGLTCNLTCNVPTTMTLQTPGDLYFNSAITRTATTLQIGDTLATRNCLSITRGAGLANTITFAASGTADIDIQQPTRVKGIANGTVVSAGYVGEYIFATVGTGTQVSMTTATYTQIASIVLTAGDWDVTGSVGFSIGGGATTTNVYGAVTTTAPPGNPGLNGGICLSTNQAIGNLNVFPVGTIRLNTATASTTIYLVASATFASGTVSGWGYIKARRVR